MVSPSAPSTETTSPSSLASEDVPSSETGATFACSILCEISPSTSSTMSRRLLIIRSRPDVSTCALTGAAGCGASVAATVGTDPMLFNRARVGPGDMVHASSSLNSPCSGSGTCSMATLAMIFKRSSASSASASRSFPALPNGHAME